MMVKTPGMCCSTWPLITWSVASIPEYSFTMSGVLTKDNTSSRTSQYLAALFQVPEPATALLLAARLLGLAGMGEENLGRIPYYVMKKGGTAEQNWFRFIFLLSLNFAILLYQIFRTSQFLSPICP